jgi:hypothetical protein
MVRNASSIGILIDAQGDDDYQVPPDVTLGYASEQTGVRATMPCFGVFLDAGGSDTYNRPYAGDNRCWGIGEGRSVTRLPCRRYAVGLDASLAPDQIESLWRRQTPSR